MMNDESQWRKRREKQLKIVNSKPITNSENCHEGIKAYNSTESYKMKMSLKQTAADNLKNDREKHRSRT